jgi:hypothetical protein
MLVFASVAVSLNPLIIKEVTTSYSFGLILVLTAKTYNIFNIKFIHFINKLDKNSTIKIVDISVIPMAYKSDKTLQQAILP